MALPGTPRGSGENSSSNGYARVRDPVLAPRRCVSGASRWPACRTSSPRVAGSPGRGRVIRREGTGPKAWQEAREVDCQHAGVVSTRPAWTYIRGVERDCVLGYRLGPCGHGSGRSSCCSALYPRARSRRPTRLCSRRCRPPPGRRRALTRAPAVPAQPRGAGRRARPAGTSRRRRRRVLAMGRRP